MRCVINPISLLLVLVSISCLFSGCEKKIDSDSLKIRYGTSFGFCSGYCYQQVEISQNVIRFTKSGRDVKTKTCTKSAGDNELSSLVNSIDFKEFSGLQSVVGCPDCADGGAEWIEIEAGADKHKVTFEYRHEPAEVKKYIGILREYKDSFKDCN